MEFAKILNPQTIMTHLDVKSKAEALDALSELFVKAGIVTDKKEYLKDVYTREEIGETGIGNHIAIPHGRSRAVTAPGAAIAVLEHEIQWESLDDTGAKVVILFAVGTDDDAANDHLRLLAMFSKRLGNNALVRKLMEADTAADVIRIFAEDTDVEDPEDKTEEAEPDLDEISIL